MFHYTVYRIFRLYRSKQVHLSHISLQCKSATSCPSRSWCSQDVAMILCIGWWQEHFVCSIYVFLVSIPTVNHRLCKQSLKHLFLYQSFCLVHHSLDLWRKRMATKNSSKQPSLRMVVTVYSTYIIIDSPHVNGSDTSVTIKDNQRKHLYRSCRSFII